MLLQKFSDELEPVSTRFEKYATAHSDVRDEVEGYVEKATALEKTAEWKQQIAGTFKRLPDGQVVHIGTSYKCEDLYQGGIPDGVVPDADGKCVHMSTLGVADYTLLTTGAMTAAAPVAFMLGGPAGTMALAGAGSFISFVGTTMWGSHHERFARDFGRIRTDLTMVHKELT